MSTHIVNIPCGHVGQCEQEVCPLCKSSNDYVIELPVGVNECREEGCKRDAVSMFAPCGCVLFCRDHAENYIAQQPCHQVLCPRFLTGDCDNHIDTIVDIIPTPQE